MSFDRHNAATPLNVESDRVFETDVMKFGAYLRSQRERRGLTIDDIHVRTKVSRSYLTALENEDMAGLPAPIFIKGFLRSYCSTLRIDAEAVVKAYNMRIGNRIEDNVINTKAFRPKTFPERVKRTIGSIRRLLTGREDTIFF